MFEIGRVCMKIAGRDAGKSCVVVEKIDEQFVMIDGETRRRKCNVRHLEPRATVVALKKGAAHDVVVAALKEAGISVKERVPRGKGAKKAGETAAAPEEQPAEAQKEAPKKKAAKKPASKRSTEAKPRAKASKPGAKKKGKAKE